MLIYVYIFCETSRLLNEVSEAESTHRETQLRLRACEKEVDRLKNQLQQYVQEVQKAEDLLYRKVRIYLNWILFIYPSLATQWLGRGTRRNAGALQITITRCCRSGG